MPFSSRRYQVFRLKLKVWRYAWSQKILFHLNHISSVSIGRESFQTTASWSWQYLIKSLLLYTKAEKEGSIQVWSLLASLQIKKIHKKIYFYVWLKQLFGIRYVFPSRQGSSPTFKNKAIVHKRQIAIFWDIYSISPAKYIFCIYLKII